MALQIGSELVVFVSCPTCGHEGQFLRSANNPPDQWRFEALVTPAESRSHAPEPIGHLDALIIKYNAACDGYGIPRQGGPSHG
jgi:hypothetical protein